MGIFSRKKTTYVSSVVYPLGEDGADRTDMLQYTILNATLQNRGISESLQQSYLRGQGMSLRNAFAYARDKYTDGLPASSARYSDQPDLSALTPVLEALNVTGQISYITTLIGTGDFAWWAERHLADIYGYDRVLQRFDAPPKGVEANANVAYDLEPDGSIQILLMNDDGATTALSYRPHDYTRLADYVHCVYQTKLTFEGGVTESTRPADVGEVDRTVYSAETVERTGETQVITTQMAVSVTGSTATVTESKSTEVTSRPKYFLYRMGSGEHPLLDEQLSALKLVAPYFPSVPLRVNNVNWTSTSRRNLPIYKTSAALLKKVGLDLGDLGKQVETNKNVKDIDHCFVAFGVRLNTDSPEGKKYIFRYLSYLRSISKATSGQFNAWVDDYNNKFPTGATAGRLPLEGVQAPAINSVEIYSTKDRANNHDVKLQWQYIDTRLVTGVVKEGARKGDVEILTGAQAHFDLLNDTVLDGSVILVRQQVDGNTYEELAVSGLTYENFIYQGHSVTVTAHDALTKPDEDGFLLPLNQEIIRATPLVEVTNLAYQCMYLVFNCYTVVKQKWYQTTLFKIIIVIIAIIIIVVSWGAATPAATGMVSAAFMTAAAAMGFTALMLTIVAATMYVLTMMVLMNILMKVAVKAFGPTWGPIIVAVLAIMSSNYANTGSAFGTAASNSSMISAQNIIQASSTIVNAYVAHEMKGISTELDKLASDYKTGMAKIEELTTELLGTNLDMLDVQGFTQAAYTMNYEMPDTFLGRTLLTGSDVCNITTGLIENFADVGLQLPTTG